MAKSKTPVKLVSYEEIMGLGDYEEIVTIAIDDIHPFKNHPFKVRDDEKMQELIEAFDFSHLVVYPGQTCLWYPEGTLKDQTPAKYWLTFDNTERIQGLYQPWARPYSY